MPGGTKKIAKNIQCSKLEFDSLSEGWPVVWIVRPRLHDPAQKGRGTAVLYEVEVWATGVEGIFPEPFLFLFGSSHQPPGPRSLCHQSAPCREPGARTRLGTIREQAPARAPRDLTCQTGAQGWGAGAASQVRSPSRFFHASHPRDSGLHEGQDVID